MEKLVEYSIKLYCSKLQQPTQFNLKANSKESMVGQSQVAFASLVTVEVKKKSSGRKFSSLFLGLFRFKSEKPNSNSGPFSDPGVVGTAQTPTTAVVEKEGLPQPEPEVEKVGKPVVECEKEVTAVKDENVAESASFKEESNKVDDLIDPEKKALDEFNHLIQELLDSA
ncbi:Phosphatidylinositol transfer protein SEC14 [Forsythia ovata]|uniref:Phosphatidylinositol transfer protein SEC14 n=1 Tax=Forsythia ovata TaxID=205694 RepID=A0ABD1W657_9LAMI